MRYNIGDNVVIRDGRRLAVITHILGEDTIFERYGVAYTDCIGLQTNTFSADEIVFDYWFHVDNTKGFRSA